MMLPPIALGSLVVVALLAMTTAIVLERIRRRQLMTIARASVRVRIGHLLAAGLVAGEPVDEVLRLLLPAHADWCMLHLIERGRVRRVAVLHTDRDAERRMHEYLEGHPFSHDAPFGPALVLRTGRSHVLRAMAPEQLSDPAFVAIGGAGSSMSVPLKDRADTIGALSLVRRQAGAYDEDDLAWAEDLAYRLGLAIENRRLFVEARELFEQTVSANFVSSPEGYLLACNQRFASLLGYDSVDDVLAVPTAELFAHAGDRERLLDELRLRRRIVGHELALRRRDGTTAWVSEDAVVECDASGAIVKVRGFLLDRTAQKDLEDRLREAQRLEAVGQLAGGIAHDFNNLLTIIMGCADLLRIDPAGGSDGPHPLDELIKASERAAGLTQQLLAFSRRQVLQPRVLHLNDALRATHPMLRRLVPAHIVLVLDFDPHVPPVLVDPGQLDRVVVNLIVNSVDALQQAGTITVTTASRSIVEDDLERHPDLVPGHYVMLSVADTGVGMDAATSVRVFEPFFTTKPVGKGTGLGLSTVYGIVKQSGGSVQVASAPGLGTTVTICLPAVGVPEALGRSDASMA